MDPKVELVIDRICERLENGETLKRALGGKGGMYPGELNRSQLNKMMAEDPTIFNRIKQAMAMGAAALADDLLEIADEEEDVQRAKVRIDVRKWLAAKFNPRMFGDFQRIEHEASGSIELVAKLSDKQLDNQLEVLSRRIAELEQKP